MHCILEFPSLNPFTNGSIHLDHRIATPPYPLWHLVKMKSSSPVLTALPVSENDRYEEYSECIDQIFEIIQKYQNSHEIVIGGDFNEDISKNNNSRRASKLKELTVFSSMHCILEFPSLNTFTNESIHLDHRIATPPYPLWHLVKMKSSSPVLTALPVPEVPELAWNSHWGWF
jgi:hypothetical protein